ncbi:MAG: hypothetical protein ABIK37_04125 [candidate division WOR-3 bacterium]
MRATIVLLAVVGLAMASLYHIDQPVPVSLGHGEYYIGARLWGEGGVMARFGIGLLDRITLGMSYSANRLLGANEPQGSRPRPELQARAQVLKEMGYVPDLVLGYESQGYDHCDGNEFEVREKGVYVVVGKTVEATRTYWEVGANWWNGFDAFLAVNQLLPADFEVMLEYDPALNDVRGEKWGPGFLNFGVAWTFSRQLRVGLALRDILGNRGGGQMNRVLDLSFREKF